MGWAFLNPGPIGLELPDLPLSIDASINISGEYPNFPHIPDLPNNSFSPRPANAREIPAIKVPGNISIPGNWSIPEEMLEFIEGAHTLRYNFITFTLYAFQIITVILLLNLLIAAMSSTVQKLQAQNNMYWKFYRTRIRITYFEVSSAMPVPFNIFHWVIGGFYYLFATIYFIWNGDKRFFFSGMNKFE